MSAFAIGTAHAQEAVPVVVAPDFARDVRPILAGSCFMCHGPDDQARQAALRLDTREGALEVIRPGRLHSNAGPDLQEAQLRIVGQLWAGSVEVHVHSS